MCSRTLAGLCEANVVQMGRLGAKVTPPTINMKAAETTRVDRFMGPSTRSRVVAYAMGHTWDIYGQMVVYVRLNGLTPPARQRP